MDVAKVRDALSLFRGRNDLRAFAGKKTSLVDVKKDPLTGQKLTIQHPPEYFVRTMENVELEQVDPPVSATFLPIYDFYDFYTVRMTSKAFFQHQVRRILEAAFAVGRDRVSLKDLEGMLRNPAGGQPQGVQFGLADPRGLHLARVQYSPEDLEGATDNIGRLPVGPPPALHEGQNVPIQWYPPLSSLIHSLSPFSKYVLLFQGQDGYLHEAD